MVKAFTTVQIGRLVKSNPIARALNKVTKPSTFKDKKKETRKLFCRKTKGGASS
jgi:hypothetical protein